MANFHKACGYTDIGNVAPRSKLRTEGAASAY